jgi:hypothetical protein
MNFRILDLHFEKQRSALINSHSLAYRTVFANVKPRANIVALECFQDPDSKKKHVRFHHHGDGFFRFIRFQQLVSHIN